MSCVVQEEGSLEAARRAVLGRRPGSATRTWSWRAADDLTLPSAMMSSLSAGACVPQGSRVSPQRQRPR